MCVCVCVCVRTRVSICGGLSAHWWVLAFRSRPTWLKVCVNRQAGKQTGCQADRQSSRQAQIRTQHSRTDKKAAFTHVVQDLDDAPSVAKDGRNTAGNVVHNLHATPRLQGKTTVMIAAIQSHQ